MSSRLSALLDRRAAARREEARRLALAVLERLAARGASLVVGGSLARDRVLPHSDVDFIIRDAGSLSYGQILTEVETIMGAFPFDLIPLADLPADAQARMTETTLDASALR